MITTIDEHSVDLSLLHEKANILDAGCRGMGFTNYFRQLGHKVVAIDIDYLENSDYRRVGLAAIGGKAYISTHTDPQARKLISPKPFEKMNTANMKTLAANEVFVLTLNQIKKGEGIESFDLIKLDIEGEEYSVLRTATHPVAKQISCEFHAHTGSQTKEELDELLEWMSEWYTIHNAVWEKRHGCSENYWDVLCTAK